MFADKYGAKYEKAVACLDERPGSFARLLSFKVSDLMTRSVITCAPEDSVADIARIMTMRRIRHIPVVDGGKVVGLVSIGDVLKSRISEIELDANVLRDLAIARQ